MIDRNKLSKIAAEKTNKFSETLKNYVNEAKNTSNLSDNDLMNLFGFKPEMIDSYIWKNTLECMFKILIARNKGIEITYRTAPYDIYVKEKTAQDKLNEYIEKQKQDLENYKKSLGLIEEDSKENDPNDDISRHIIRYNAKYKDGKLKITANINGKEYFADSIEELLSMI